MSTQLVSMDDVGEAAQELEQAFPERALALSQEMLEEVFSELVRLLPGLKPAWLGESMAALPARSTPQEYVRQGWQLHDWGLEAGRTITGPYPLGIAVQALASSMVIHGESVGGRRGARAATVPWRTVVELGAAVVGWEHYERELQESKKETAKNSGRGKGQALALPRVLERVRAAMAEARAATPRP